MSLSHPLSSTSPCTWCQGSLSFLNSSNYQAFLSACCSKSLGHNSIRLVYFSHRFLSENTSDKVQWAVAQRNTNNWRLSATRAWDIGKEKEDEWEHPALRSSELTIHGAHQFSWSCTLRWQGMTRAWSDQNRYWMTWTLHSRFPSLGQSGKSYSYMSVFQFCRPYTSSKQIELSVVYLLELIMCTMASEDKSHYLDSKYTSECISSWDILWAMPSFFLFF